MKRLKTAILGCGNIAGGYDERPGATGTWTHAKAYQAHGGFELVRAYDPAQPRLMEFCARWGVEAPASSIADALGSKPEVVSICSPNASHFDALREVLAADSVRAILCEKPLTLTSREAEEVRALAEKRGVPVLVNYLRRWDQLFQETGGAWRAGEFGAFAGGRVLYTKGVFHNASHAINLLEHWLGAPNAVRCQRAQKLEGDLLADFTLEWSGGNVQFHGLDHRNFNLFEIELFTSRGRLRFPRGIDREFYPREASPLAAGEFSLGAASLRTGTLPHAMERVAANLYDAAESGAALAMSLGEAVATVATCEKVKEQA